MSNGIQGIYHRHDWFLFVHLELRTELFFKGIALVLQCKRLRNERFYHLLLMLLLRHVYYRLQFFMVFQKLTIHRGVFGVELDELFRVVGRLLLQPVIVSGIRAVNVRACREGKFIFCLGHKFIFAKVYIFAMS